MIRMRALVALLAVSVLLVACSDDPTVDPDPTAAPTVPATTEPAGEPSPSPQSPADELLTIEVRDGQVQGGVPTIEATIGETVTFQVLADVADEVHVHGFDHHVDVVPGEVTLVEFEAGFAGQFEVELEEAGLLIVELVVR